MIPFSEAAEALKAKAKDIIDAAYDQEYELRPSKRNQSRLQSSKAVEWTNKSFHFDENHQMWNCQGATTTGERTIFTHLNVFCTCGSRRYQGGNCKHIISLAGNALKFINTKQGE